MKRQYSNLEKNISFLFPFLPFLWPYRILGTTINLQVGVLFATTLYLLFNKDKKAYSWPKFYRFFLVYALIAPFFGFLKYGEFSLLISSYTPIVTFTLSYIVLKPYLVFDLVYKNYKKLATIAVFFFLFQCAMYYIVGYRIVGLIPFLPVSHSELSMSEYIDLFRTLDRSASFFLEPSHFSQYIAAFLAMHLGVLNMKKRLVDRTSVFVSLALMLTFSGSAYVLVGIIWLMHFIFSDVKVYNKAILGGIAFVGIIFISGSFIQSEGGSHVMDRADALTEANENSHQSEYIRIYRGWALYNDTPIGIRITGIGSANVICLINSSRLRWAFSIQGRDDTFLNNAQVLCIGYGYIGTALFLLYLFWLIYRQERLNAYMITAFIALSFFEGFWCNSLMLIFLMIPTICMKQRRISKVKQRRISKVKVINKGVYQI